MKKQVKVIPFEIKEIDDQERSFLAVASTEDVDRGDDRIFAGGWDLSNFMKNPVVPWAHRYGEPPVAQAKEVWVEEGKLMFRPKFPTREEYGFADTIYNLYRGGYLRSFSVGFMPKRYEIVEREKGRRGYDFHEQELWEISACTVPSNPNALIAAKAKGVINEREYMELHFEAIKDICGSRSLPTNPVESWDADAAVGRLRQWAGGPDKENIDWEKYKKCFVCRDEADKENFGAYKLPFADIIDGKATATWGGVHSAMGVVLGAMGGVDIPEDDCKVAHGFLGGYYKKFDKPVPDYRAAKKLLAIEQRLDDLERIAKRIEHDPVAWIRKAINDRPFSERLDDMEDKLGAIEEAVDGLREALKQKPEQTPEEADEEDSVQTETPSLTRDQVTGIIREVVDLTGSKIGAIIDKKIKYHLGKVD